MTPSRYLFARVALAFGISRRQRRMAEAASETHLLREAEQMLGEKVWMKVESVEELGVEYWNLRRLTTEREELEKKATEAEITLLEAHERRTELLNAKSERQEELEAERSEFLDRMNELAKERDQIVSRARDLRRLYDGLKTKLEVLKSEGKDDDETVKKSEARMKELRGEFEELKTKRGEVATRIAERNEKLDELDAKIDDERKIHRTDAAEAFQAIGDANRKISSFKAEIGLIETQMQQLYGEIGRHVSRNTRTNPICQKAAADGMQSLVEVMSALRKSINLNHRLTGM